MNITLVDEKNTDFSELQVGDTFTHQNTDAISLYMKIHETNTINTVNLADGWVYETPNNTGVKNINKHQIVPI